MNEEKSKCIIKCIAWIASSVACIIGTYLTRSSDCLSIMLVPVFITIYY